MAYLENSQKTTVAQTKKGMGRLAGNEAREVTGPVHEGLLGDRINFGFHPECDCNNPCKKGQWLKESGRQRW